MRKGTRITNLFSSPGLILSYYMKKWKRTSGKGIKQYLSKKEIRYALKEPDYPSMPKSKN
jgi:hypothetical protein